jgi:hypothetical protein
VLLGLVPSDSLPAATPTGGAVATAAAAAVVPDLGRSIYNFGGWYIEVWEASEGKIHSTAYSGWTVMPPAGAQAAARIPSAYATTAVVPPVRPGSAVKFTMDYAAGTCRVAFYSPAAVAGGFVEGPDAKMELRFVATNECDTFLWGHVPARSVPTEGAALHPAVTSRLAGDVLRFIAP